MYNIRRVRDKRNTLLRRYESQLGRLVERNAAKVALLAANYDSLTQLPNRTLFVERLSHALSRGRRDNSRVAVLFVDLDHFKKVNDTLGHTAGDKLLQEAARRLTACMRETDTVARFGGDEFTVILPDLQDAHNTKLVARKILECLAEPFVIDGAEIFVTGTLGITVFPDDGEDTETLLKNADTAMYKGKGEGRNTFRFFTAKMNAEALEYLELENALRHAIKHEQFILDYQPIIDLKTGRVTSAEALLRWNHPERGLVAPNEFVSLAEETGMIVPIGEWVLRTACEQMNVWRNVGLSSVHLSVNVSARQSRDAAFKDMIKGVLKETGADPKSITLEITESLFMEDEDNALTFLREFRDMGINLSLDDFGTGYSSVSYLKRFPVNILKIDRSFVVDIGKDTESRGLVEAIIAMAHSQNMKVIAEGAETEEQVEFLRSRQCDEVQGFYFSHPLPPEEFAAYIGAQAAA